MVRWRALSVGFGLALAACGGAVPSAQGDAGTYPTPQDGAQLAGTQTDAAQPTQTDGATQVDPGDMASGEHPDAVAATPPSDWEKVTANLSGMTSECGNVSTPFANPQRDELIVGIARQGLWASNDGAASWHHLGATGDPILNRTSAIVWDPAHIDTFYQSGIYAFENPTSDGVFITTNDGTSFQGFSALDHNDSVAVDFTDPDRKTIIAGGHEQKQLLWLSTDGGETWNDIGMHMPAGVGFCTATAVIDSKTFLVGCAISWSGASKGAILRSTDGGATFTSLTDKSISGQPLRASDGTIYWSIEGGGIMKSTDKGVSFNQVASNNDAGSLPPLELPDGRIVSTHGSQVVVSPDKGVTWKNIGDPIPFNPNGFTYSPQRSAFFASYFTCSGSNNVPADGIVRYGWDYRVNK